MLENHNQASQGLPDSCASNARTKAGDVLNLMHNSQVTDVIGGIGMLLHVLTARETNKVSGAKVKVVRGSCRAKRSFDSSSFFFPFFLFSSFAFLHDTT